jgi:hypothetical protein
MLPIHHSPFPIHHGPSYNPLMRRRWKALVAVGAVALAVALLGRLAAKRDIPFDKSVWDRGPEISNSEYTPRRRMLGAVLKALPTGTSSEEVRKLLGEPDYLPPPNHWPDLQLPELGHHKDVKLIWGYCLADVQTSSFGIPSLWLVYLFFGLSTEEKVLFAVVQTIL